MAIQSMKNKLNTWLPYLKNKYLLTIIVFLIWLLVFDQNNLMERFRLIRQLNRLKNEKTYYLERIEEDTRRYEELKTNNKNLEKFAREQYLMKKKDEDIFIVVEE